MSTTHKDPIVMQKYVNSMLKEAVVYIDAKKQDKAYKILNRIFAMYAPSNNTEGTASENIKNNGTKLNGEKTMAQTDANTKIFIGYTMGDDEDVTNVGVIPAESEAEAVDAFRDAFGEDKDTTIHVENFDKYISKNVPWILFT